MGNLSTRQRRRRRGKKAVGKLGLADSLAIIVRIVPLFAHPELRYETKLTKRSREAVVVALSPLSTVVPSPVSRAPA